MNAPEFLSLLREAVRDRTDADGPTAGVHGPFALGTVDEGYTSGRPRVRFDDETSASVATRPYLSSYTPAAGDRVLLGRVGHGWVVLGSVT